MLQAELVDPAGQPGVGESRLRDERGELSVGRALWGSFRHQLYRSPAFRAELPGFG